MDWQPIETAPRDGTRILLYRPLADRTNEDKIDIKRGVPRDNTCWEETIPQGMDATNYTDGACKATHWMPLPEPPKVGVGGTAPDLSKCPACGGPADNGHDRCYPPSPYFCTKCEVLRPKRHNAEVS